MHLCLLSPIGNRPKLWALTERYMARQDFTGKVTWIVTDDCALATPINFSREHWTLNVIRPTPLWEPGMNTQDRNMLALLDAVPQDAAAVAVIEDDWYAPDYLRRMSTILFGLGVDCIGEGNARYYNIATGYYKTQQNKYHASLCQTMFKRKLLPLWREACSSGELFFDTMGWRLIHEYMISHALLDVSEMCVGIKGFHENRMSIGMGHRKNFSEKRDNFGDILREWVGLEDALVYQQLVKEAA
jgi:hypothetical protein